MERVLVVTASIGSGHVRAAEAISHEVIRQYPDADVRVVDFMSSETAYLNAFLKAFYLKMLDFVPNLYAFLYHTTSGPAGRFSAQNLIAWQMKHNMESLVRRYAPDVVICTHPFPAAAASCLKKSKDMRFLFVTVMTDYSVHQMWVYNNVDSYFVATEKMRQDLIQYGFAEKKVKVSGIPIEADFQLLPEQSEALAGLGLSDEKPVVLIMGGGLGLGGENFALEALEALDMPLQILVAAGQNLSLLREVQRFAERSHNTVMVFGYTDKVRELMAASNLLISKPGALTISEALAMRLPMVLHEPIPGPETENAVYQSQQGTAVWLKSDQGLAAAVRELLLQPERLDRMKQCAKICCKPFAARDIVLHIAGQMEESGEKEK
jgi:processive 1,2-diacylglycerol beta-glucosyltransferase